ncbi:unnamed protein product [Trifolium pratense]|uniref:Uncharacterized protein n=1 Tax=Trifolium pratense TaxID=57577 RepID=A0ACB0KZE1_TRIPR|nr:unnamed protein product [Trifolium pratense]
MSDSAKSSPTKTNDVPSLQQMVIDAIPLNTIPPTSPTMKRISTVKKVKSSRTSANSSSPATIKGSKRKNKKAKGESSKSFTMSELHIDPLPSSGAATPVANPTVENVDTSGKTSVNIGLNIPKSVKTLGVETPAISGILGKSVPNTPIAVDANIGASTETNDVVAAESLKKTGPETHVASSVATPDAEPNVVLDVTTSLAQENLVDYSVSDESPQPKSADKDDNENPDVVIINETTVSDKAVPTNSEASVARRTRSRAGKGVETANTPVQSTKPSRAGKGTGKKPLYGPPKPVSKVIPRTEAKKRKAPPTSDSEFEPETDVAASGSTSRKSIGRKKVPQSVPYAPLDNVSFHLENGSARWKFVYHRRLALERNLKEDILQCQSVVEAIEYAGLMKTVFGLDKCYDRLVKEFLINVAENCNDPTSPEYRQVFVRGKCVKFSPTVINQHLLRSSDEVAALKVTDNEVCKVLTRGRIKVWPTKAKLAATSLSPFYAVLNRIAVHNWVPTTHSGDVARGLGKFIYVVGTKFMLMTQSNFEAMKSSQATSNKNHEASIKNLEVQMGQLSRQFSMLQNQGGFGGNTHDNPKNETCNGITLRSREIPERPAVEKPLKKKVIEGEVENKQEVVVENERHEGEVENEIMSKEVEISEDEEEEVEKQREIKEKESKKVEKGKICTETKKNIKETKQVGQPTVEASSAGHTTMAPATKQKKWRQPHEFKAPAMQFWCTNHGASHAYCGASHT